MKKLLLSLLICMGIMTISSQSYAQNEAGEKLQPFVGNTYNYSFNVPANLKYDFYISESATGQGVVSALYGAYIQGNTAGVKTGITGGSAEDVAVDIAWPSGVSSIIDKKVYLFIKVYQDPSTTICENYNAVEIKPITNAFEILLADATVGGPTTCPDLVGFDPLVIPNNYNAGKTTLTYTIERTGASNDWNLKFDIKQLSGNGVFKYSTDGGAPTIVGTTTTNVTLDNIAAATNIITVKIELVNMPGQDPQFAVLVKEASDVDTEVNPLTYPAELLHTIKIMPIIGTFN